MLYKTIIIGWLALCMGYFSGAQSFQYQRALVPDSAGGWHTAVLPATLVGKASYDFADLRINAVQANGDTIGVPYFVQPISSKPSPVTIPFKLLNQVAQGGQYFYTFKLQDKAIIQSISLDFGTENFDWLISLEGSHDQTNWFGLLEDYRIVSIKNQLTDYQFTQLLFKDADFLYYRVKIPATSNPNFKQATLFKPVKDSFEYYAYPTLRPAKPTTNQQNESVWIFDLPEMVPVSQLQVFSAPDESFISPFKIFLLDPNIDPDDALSQNYVSLFSGTLSSFDPKTFTFSNQITRQIKLVVNNYDNAPISIDSVHIAAPQRILVTQLPSYAASYFIWYGAPNAIAPLYDIAAIYNSTKGISPKMATLGDEQFIGTPPKAATKLWWEKPIVLYSLMGVIILLLGYFTVSLIQKKQEEPTD